MYTTSPASPASSGRRSSHHDGLLGSRARSTAGAGGRRGFAWWFENGHLEKLSPDAAARRARATPPLLVHFKATAAKLGVEPFMAFDLLDLFAFVRPARFCLPTPHGLLERLNLDAADDEEAVQYLHHAAQMLLEDLPRQQPRSLRRSMRLAQLLNKAGWPGHRICCSGLGPKRRRHPAAVSAGWISGRSCPNG